MRRGAGPAPHVEVGAARPAAPPRLTLDEAGATPILREYRAVRAAHPATLVLARLGDFFELFGEDAELAAPILGVALTGRGFGGAGRLPMCGVPAAAATQYIGRLLAAGHRVVVWDQVEEPGPGRGLVRREVTRVLSPGTVLDEAFLAPQVAVRCVSLWAMAGRVGVAALDAGGGELQLGELAGGMDTSALAEELERLQAAELLVPEGEPADGLLAGIARTQLPPAWFDAERGAQRLREATGTASLAGLGVAHLRAAQAAAAALLAYCERSRLALPSGYLRVRARDPSRTMSLDAPTRRNLELLGGLRGDPGLLGLLDRTRTPMGARLLRARLQEPLLDATAIEGRLAAVAALREDRGARAELRAALRQVRDLERLVGRCVQGMASPRDLSAVASTCASLPRVAALAAALGDAAGGPDRTLLQPPPDLAPRLQALLVDDPPATLREGGAVRPGADAELDGLRAAGSDARSFIASLEDQERARTGIRSLRVGYNRVFGYYLEVPNAHREAVPADYHRKQTLVGAERYITPLLKEQEAVVLSARERSLAREAELVAAAVAEVAGHAAALLAAADVVARLDVAQALAEVADEHDWCRPRVDGSLTLEIEAGRHPLVEQALPAGAFVPNDCVLVGHTGSAPGPPGAQVMVVTGPNMAGKSTYLRQVALTVLLAQVGSFVPARAARVGLCDRIFTRVGAQDDLARGLSTFMVEMTETAAILNCAGARSLVVLDEIGRGTSTYDGLSIAQAVVEHLHDAPHLGCRTLFATHYHELTGLAERLPRVRNARVDVVEEGETVSFLHRIVEGGADRSYGIHVARLAGVPAAVVARARQLLVEHEQRQPIAADARGRVQLALPLADAAHPVVEELGRLDLDGLTPLQALNKLAEWRQRVSDPHGPAAPR